MKILLILITSFMFISCNEKPAEDPAKTVINPDFIKKHQVSIKEEKNQGSFVQENTSCICTKEYKPVCGSDGNTYPSGCQAGCSGIKEFTEGPCQK